MRIPADYKYVTQEDYVAVCGPDWPNYENFCKNFNVPDWVYQEIDEMLPRKEPFTHPSWCVNPFYSYELPQKTHCCLLPKEHNIFEIRQKMLDGKRPEECSACWNLEDKNLLSDRIIKNQSLDYWSGIDAETLYNQSVSGNYETLHYKIDTSNSCNGICVTCNSSNSSSWDLINTKNNIIAKSNNWTVGKKELDDFINYETLKIIVFRGGEPLLSNTNFEILENLINAGNTDCFVSFVTNASLRPTLRQMYILDKFKNVNFCFSVDGIQKRFEYIRFPLKWQSAMDNIFWAQDKNYHVSVSYTLSNLNVLYHNETVSWFKENNIPFLINPVYNPAYFSPRVLPDSVKKAITESDSEHKLDKLILSNTKNNLNLWNKFVSEIHRQDKIKQIKIDNYLPELANIIKNN